MSEFNSKRRILLVDDNSVNLKILEKILEDDYETEVAHDGKEALERLNASIICSTPFSLVILDIIMPIMDGYDVLKHMRLDEQFKYIPVIVATASQNNEDIDVEEKALMLGANDYITKPYKPNVLKRRIENTLYVHDTADFVSIARNDPLTGLYSKEYFHIKASEILKQNIGKKYDLICCDIERFKLVNDLYGTKIGDKLLKSCAKICKEKISGNGIYGRIAPDVFAFLVSRHETSYAKYFNEMLCQVNKLNLGLNIEIKFGIYPINDISEPISIMCDHAKLALNTIKGKYGLVYQYYDVSIRNKMIEEQYLITHMKQALDNHEFEVYFQPKYEISSNTIVGAEALVRWINPEKGFLSPASFIPLFEKNGFITKLDKYVWDESLRCLRNWISSKNEVVPLSLNLSRADFYDSKIDKYLESLIHKYDIEPQLIHLEVTESAYALDPKQIIKTLECLKSFGFKVDMDDFGSGYSSLNMLSDLPIDVLKLDMGFMKNIHLGTNKNILSFIINLAKMMNLDIVAEGAETKEQVNMLQNLGCNVVQGYFYSKPLNRKDFEDKLSLQQKSIIHKSKN